MMSYESYASSFHSAFIAFEAFPRPKGAASHIASTVQALAQSYPPVLLLCLGYSDMPAYQEEGDITIIRYKLYHPNMLERAKGFAEFIYEIINEIEKNLQLCVFRDPWGGYPAIRTNRHFATIFEVNALPSWELSYTYPLIQECHALLEKIKDMEYYCLQHSDAIITVSPVTKRALVHSGISPKRIISIPNAAADIFFDCSKAAQHTKTNSPDGARAKKKSSHKEIPIKEMANGRWFGYIGSLHPWQGIDVAVDAFALVAEDLPDYKMLILTGGRKEALKKLKKQIKKNGLEERVLIHKPLIQRELAVIIAGLEFTVAPLLETRRNTEQGCCPIKIIESLACGTPVISSDLEVTRALMRHGYEGLLVTPGNRRALALAIKQMDTQPGMIKSMSHYASVRAKNLYSVTIIHAQLIAYFNQITNIHKREREDVYGDTKFRQPYNRCQNSRFTKENSGQEEIESVVTSPEAACSLR